ncbi:MAG: hypothetical protein A2939_01550 [Parcubacteria group bacterium RIFCSPLOWO2_01_FULL_48_18]|nr:MAG: hypothetical protein A2939_01550 [Parcubacteria group bacterium RIFCSPLOWO2_01_FULL_48_18]OHB23834.1 MAG: hypothetical protein A3J67_02175 [Parcubacteria group bacterium RIFCSPHIGHO2_02_FULL_48_10b]
MSYRAATKGFSLIELIIYIAILSIISLLIVNILLVVLKGGEFGSSRFEVEQNIRFALDVISRSIYDASNATTTGSCPLNALELAIGGATTTFLINTGILEIIDASGTRAITSDKVTVSSSSDASCLFAKTVNSSPAKPTVTINFQIGYNDKGNLNMRYSNSAKTTISLR